MQSIPKNSKYSSNLSANLPFMHIMDDLDEIVINGFLWSSVHHTTNQFKWYTLTPQHFLQNIHPNVLIDAISQYIWYNCLIECDGLH